MIEHRGNCGLSVRVQCWISAFRTSSGHTSRRRQTLTGPKPPPSLLDIGTDTTDPIEAELSEQLQRIRDERTPEHLAKLARELQNLLDDED